MKAAIISQQSLSSQWTRDAMKKYFDSVDDINIKDIEINLGVKGSEILVKGEPLGRYDCIYAKGSFRFTHLLESLTYILEKQAFMPIGSAAFSIGHDKLLTHIKLQEHQVPMPITYITSTTEAAKKLLEQLNYPIIVKLPKGTQGKGVMYADSYPSANSILDAMSALKQPFIIQEYVETDGTDIRAIVVGDRVVAAYCRKAKPGEKRANIHQGGHGEPCELDSASKRIAVKAAAAVGAEICGVDLLEAMKGRTLVIEVNLSPGLQGVTSTTKIDVADQIAKFLHRRTSERMSANREKTADDIVNEVGMEEKNGVNDVITHLDFRGDRILLPEMVTRMTKFSEKDEFVLEIKEGKLKIKKL